MMITNILLLFAGLALLYFGAELLIRGSVSLALRLGVSSLIVGLTIVAFGTSAPELVVSLKSGLNGLGDLAVGNVIGSNVFNIALILGVSGLIRPLKVNLKVLRIDAPIMVAVSVLVIIFLKDFHISRLEGGFLVLGITGYTLFSIIITRKSRDINIGISIDNLIPRKKTAVFRDVLFIASGLGLLVLGSQFFVNGSVDLARLLGVSEAIIGLTLVAAGTSLPELATSIIAAIKKEEDIAIGNIIGSNIFNILGILGITSVFHPLYATGIDPGTQFFLMGTALLVLPFMRTGFKLTRLEGGLLLCIYGGYLYYLWPK